MAGLIDPNLAAAQSAAAAAWAAVGAARAQLAATYVAAAGSFLVAGVTGFLTYREALRGKRARRYAAVEALRSAAMMIRFVWHSAKSEPADGVTPFERLKGFAKIAGDAVSASGGQATEDKQLILLTHQMRRTVENFRHMLDRVEHAHPRLKLGAFLAQHGDWEDLFKPTLEKIDALTD
jgi:hypothetical protein